MEFVVRTYYSKGGGLKRMGQTKLGRYCKQKIGWLIPEMWKKWWRKKKKLSKMRAYCKSKSDEQRAACGCRKKKTSKSEYRPYT